MIGKNWRSYFPIFLPLLWMPLVAGGLSFFLHAPLDPLGTWFPIATALYYLLQGLVLIALVHSIYRCWKLRGSGRLPATLVYAALVPVQVVVIAYVGLLLFGKWAS